VPTTTLWSVFQSVLLKSFVLHVWQMGFNVEVIVEMLKLHELKWHVLYCSAVSKNAEGLYKRLDWILSELQKKDHSIRKPEKNEMNDRL